MKKCDVIITKRRRINLNYLMLMLVVLGVSIQSIAIKAYKNKVQNVAYSFTVASVFFAMIIFIITSGGKLEFTSEILIYSVLFAVSYSAASVCSFLAISTGSLSLSSLVIQYSLIIPTFYGFIMLGESFKASLIVGILLLLISLVFINFEGKEEKKITFKWTIFAFLAFVGNGMCSTVQKVQQLEFGGKYKSELMIVALFISIIVLLCFALFTEKKNITYNLKKGFLWYLICGIANGIVNLLVLALSSKMPASVMFPVISAGGIILTAIVSVTIYKEKLSPQQKTGLILGIISIIALNI